MKFDELDEQLRIHETAHDYCVIPGIYIVARFYSQQECVPGWISFLGVS
jgi:hypothetical protein